MRECRRTTRGSVGNRGVSFVMRGGIGAEEDYK